MNILLSHQTVSILQGPVVQWSEQKKQLRRKQQCCCDCRCCDV